MKKFGGSKEKFYLCIVKKEFGKWLMDIAKYMVTALLLSTIFSDMQEPIIIYMCGNPLYYCPYFWTLLD